MLIIINSKAEQSRSKTTKKILIELTEAGLEEAFSQMKSERKQFIVLNRQ
jgi:hypothetical protein